MDLKQLSYFVAVVEEGNITKAAARLHISQPPLSTQIRLLEEELGIKLLERGPRQISLSQAGQLLYCRAKTLLTLADTAAKELKEFAATRTETLHLGTISTTSAIILDPRIMEYHKKNPHIRFEIHEGNTNELFGWLNAGIVELAITRTPVADESFRCFCLRPPEPMVALMRRELDWCMGRSQIAFSELAGRPLIYHRRYRTLVEDECRKNGFSPYCVSISNVRNSVLWAASGIGIALVPQAAVFYAPGNGLVSKALDFPPADSQQCVAWHRERPLSPPARRFLSVLGCKSPRR